MAGGNHAAVHLEHQVIRWFAIRACIVNPGVTPADIDAIITDIRARAAATSHDRGQ